MNLPNKLTLLRIILIPVFMVVLYWGFPGANYVALAIFVVAAILTPPDVVSQLLMACPMLVLYELSILVAATFGRKKTKPESEENAENQAESDEKNAEEV